MILFTIGSATASTRHCHAMSAGADAVAVGNTRRLSSRMYY